uniref:HNH nuclease domain-containing protein n=1 Tax=viral metagenome TaxID=1070528 RepID=A0A6C0E553_9ZZZZ
MKIELLILIVTIFFMYNAYYDGKIVKKILHYKKYYQIAIFGLLGIGIYLIIKRNPNDSRKILMNANNMVKYMPIDKSSLDMISPILDFTSQGENDGGFGNSSFMNDLTNQTGGTQYPYGSGFFNKLGIKSSERRILESGRVNNNYGNWNTNGNMSGGRNNTQEINNKKATKRSVSETKKKYVASLQNWRCGHCQNQLNAWFEVDHKMRLENGGGNEVDNLIALCRDCHGKKTAMENM